MIDRKATWADSWVSSQQALLNTMFPVPPPGGADATGTKTQLEEQFAELRDTWKDSMEKWVQQAQNTDTGSLSPEALQTFFSPANWSGTSAFDAGLRHVVDGPKYAVLFDLDRKLLVLRQLAGQRDKDVAAFQGIMMKAWNEAFKRFSTTASPGKEQGPVTWRGMADRWISIVNDTLIEVHRTESFIEAQRKMLRSASDYRLQERKIAEAWCDAFHIPTRTEMDEMQRTVTELKRELRAVRRRIVPQPAKDEAQTPPPRIPTSGAKVGRSNAA